MSQHHHYRIASKDQQQFSSNPNHQSPQLPCLIGCATFFFSLGLFDVVSALRLMGLSTDL